MLRPFKKPKGAVLQISKAEINEYNRALKEAEEELKLQTIKQCAILYTAFAMEEEVIDRDPEKIIEMYTKLNEWANHVKMHTISINTVVDIINEATGTELLHWGKEDAEQRI